MDEWNDNPSGALVSKAQLLLFPASPRALCENIGLNWWAVLKLSDDGWLSFDPESTVLLDGAQEAELCFIGALINGGCDPNMLEHLLVGLSKPYCYQINKIYYDWSDHRWRLLPESQSQVTIELGDVSNWIVELKDSNDLETLECLAGEISAAIAEIKTT